MDPFSHAFILLAKHDERFKVWLFKNKEAFRTAKHAPSAVYQEILELFSKAQNDFEKGNFSDGCSMIQKIAEHSTRVYGPSDHVTQTAIWMSNYLYQLKDFKKQQQDFCLSYADIRSVSREISGYRDSIYPKPKASIELIEKMKIQAMESAYSKLLPELGVDASEEQLALICSNATKLPEAISIIREMIKITKDKNERFELNSFSLIFLSACEQELGSRLRPVTNVFWI